MPKIEKNPNNLAGLLLSLYSVPPLSNCISEQKPVSFIQTFLYESRKLDSMLCLPPKQGFIIKYNKSPFSLQTKEK